MIYYLLFCQMDINPAKTLWLTHYSIKLLLLVIYRPPLLFPLHTAFVLLLYPNGVVHMHYSPSLQLTLLSRMTQLSFLPQPKLSYLLTELLINLIHIGKVPCLFHHCFRLTIEQPHTIEAPKCLNTSSSYSCTINVNPLNAPS